MTTMAARRNAWISAAASLTLVVCARASTAQVATTPVPMPRAQRADTIRLDLTKSIQIALRNATPILVGQDSVRLSAIALLESYGRFLPSLTTTMGGFDEAGNTLLSSTSLVPADAEFYGLGYQLTAGINLFNGYRDREHMRASSSLREAAASGLARVQQEVAFDVAQAFFQVVLDQRLRDVAVANLDLSRTREAQLTDEVRIGTKAPPDLYQQQAQRSADESALIDAENRVETDATALLVRLRLDPTSPYEILDPPADTTAIPADSLRPEILVAQALRARPDIASAAERTDADQHEMIVAHGAYLPKLSLSFDAAAGSRVFGHEFVGGVDQLTTSQRSLFDQLGNQWTGALSLGLSWNVFDNYQARLDVERATVALDRDRLSTEDLRLRVAGDVQQALGDYHAAVQKLQSSADGLASAQLAYDAVQSRYDVGGLASFVDVLTAQTALTRARALREQALTNFALQKAELRYAVGAPPVPTP